MTSLFAGLHGADQWADRQGVSLDGALLVGDGILAGALRVAQAPMEAACQAEAGPCPAAMALSRCGHVYKRRYKAASLSCTALALRALCPLQSASR